MTPAILLLPSPVSDAGLSMTRYAQELFSALSRVAKRSRVITLDQPVQRRYLSRVFDHHQTRRLETAWCRYVTYPGSLRQRRANVFHVLDQGYAHLIRSLDPERTVVTCHDLIPLLAANGVIPLRVPATVVRTFRWRIAHMARARAVIAVSGATKATLERYTSVPPDRITVVPQGVNSTFGVMPGATAPTRASAGLSDASAVLLHVATTSRYKNTPVLLHAFAQLRSSLGTDVTLVRIGAPLYPDETELASKLGILNSILYVGMVNDRTLAEWYNAADVLVFPSLWEGFGWPPLEAMACGTPVVASNVPAVAEVVGDAGLLVPADNPSAVAQAAERVLTDTALATSLCQKGRDRAKQFTWEETAVRTLAVYDSVLQ